MALVEVFHVVASELPINPISSTDIPQGSVVVLDANALIDVAVATNTVADVAYPVGLAGDSRSQGTTSYTPDSGSALNTHIDDGSGAFVDNFTVANWSPAKGALVMGAWGEQERFTQSHVADNYNEVFASGKMTVYHSGGEFWTDQFLIADNDEQVQSWQAGKPCFMAASVAGKITVVNPADSADVTGTYGAVKNRVGLVLRTGADPAVGAGSIDYPSGVPGTDTPWLHLNEGGNSLTYGRFVLIKLDL